MAPGERRKGLVRPVRAGQGRGPGSRFDFWLVAATTESGPQHFHVQAGSAGEAMSNAVARLTLRGVDLESSKITVEYVGEKIE